MKSPLTLAWTGVVLCASAVSGQSGPAPATLSGRCAEEETGAPLEGCVVTATAFTYQSHPLGWRHPEWIRPLESITDARGRFTISLDPPDEHFSDGDRRPTLRLEFRHSSRCPSEGSFPLEAFGPGEHWEIDDVRMVQGVPATLRVRDENGRPVAGVDVNLFRRPEGDGPEPDDAIVQKAWLRGLADGSGDTPFAAIQPGRWSVEVHGRDVIAPSRGLVFPRTPGTPLDITIRIRSAPAKCTLAGHILDRTGAPWVGLRVRASWDDAMGGLRRAGSRPVRTGPDGGFRIEWPWKNGNMATVEIPPEDRRRGTVDVDLGEHAWGSQALDLVLPRGGPLGLEVVAAATGRPVEDFTVECAYHPMNLDPGPDNERRHHPGGRLDIHGLAPGRHQIDILPLESGLVPRIAVPVEVRESAPARVRVDLEPAVARTMELSLQGGAPAAGSVVEVVVPLPDETPDFQWAASLREQGRRRSSSPETTRADSQTTDAHGRVVLHAALRAWPVWIRARGPGHVPILKVLPAWLPSEEVIRIPVSAGACIRGTAGPAPALALLGFSGTDDLAPIGVRNLTPVERRPSRADVRWWRRPHIEVHVEPLRLVTAPSLSEEDLRHLFEWRLPIAPDGSFALNDLPPSRVSLRMVADVGDTGRVLLGFDTVELRSGETREVRLSVPAAEWIERAVRGSVLRDGKPWAQATVELYAPPGPAPGWPGPKGPVYVLRAGEDGSLTPKVLRPGVYHAVAVGFTGDGEAAERIPCDEVLDITAGGGVFVLHARTERVRFGWKDGRRSGPWIHWHRNGQKASEGAWKDGWREGRWRFWHDDGTVDQDQSGTYVSGIRRAR